MGISQACGSILTGSQKSQLLAVERTQEGVDREQLRLASGRDVNSALDNPQNFFQSRSLTERAGDLQRLLDGIQQSINTVRQADNGIEAILRLVDQAEALLVEAETSLFTDELAGPNVVPNDIDDFVSYSGAQDADNGIFELRDDNTTVFFEGNLWKALPFEYEVTEETILRFDYSSTSPPEISTIGFDDDLDFFNDTNRFFLNGTQQNNTAGFFPAPLSEFEYDRSGDTVTYEIEVGQFFTGDFSYITFLNDHDVASNFGNAVFSNIRVFESSEGLNFELNQDAVTQFRSCLLYTSDAADE